MANKLGRHDGKEIIGCAIAVRNAGDGLSKAMQVEPKIIKDGSTVYILMEGTVHGIDYKDVPNNDTKTMRVHIVKAGTATLVDKEFAEETLQKQADAIEAFQGINKLDFTAGSGEEGDEAESNVRQIKGGGDGDEG